MSNVQEPQQGRENKVYQNITLQVINLFVVIVHYDSRKDFIYSIE